jgi:hypothetical protein
MKQLFSLAVILLLLASCTKDADLPAANESDAGVVIDPNGKPASNNYGIAIDPDGKPAPSKYSGTSLDPSGKPQ